jgi:Fic family protein
MKEFIYQLDNWPNFSWRIDELINLLSEVRHLQGRLTGRMESLGFALRNEAALETMTLEIIKSNEIEGEVVNPGQLRSSIARKLGMEIAGSVESGRNVDGLADMMLDATRNCSAPLTSERLFDWHAALFPLGRNSMQKITVADWRKDSSGPMQVVSGAVGKEKVHFRAPDAALVEGEMQRFLDWFNREDGRDLVIKAAVAHLWFVTIHPFSDGNGRISRALTEMLLARSDNSTLRFYSMSVQIRLDRTQYYKMLEKPQKGDLDITPWISWFLNCLASALKSTDSVLNKVLFKADFWRKQDKTILNERQLKLLNRILDGFEGKLTSSKWAKIANCSKETAVRDINDLISKNILQREEAGGRSTNYELMI